MHTITVTETVWQAIASRGKFGETEDDVLRRVFDLPAGSSPNDVQKTKEESDASTKRRSSGPRRSLATDRMSSYLSNNQLHVSFVSGPSSSWTLPSKTDKKSLRAVREKAIVFAKKHGATLGQENAVKKTLTDAGYHLTK
ncbi:hypothetical protein [Candidatus Nitrotoga sp. 1052]|uniref:hypothetical protein n=1 Tax=Candidatus Nitrotoga sp. 1052 TaxID=2886964 RepID=UPI001EF6134A|nr:hypothetical protein [Candidatus Nitrotoga sp. 1052]CAH1088206.1 conserved hypothetical protein [Candidatus Nitrotoga sp. 1052]